MSGEISTRAFKHGAAKGARWEELDSRRYFESILEKAWQAGRIDLERVRQDCWKVWREQCARFAKGESGSLLRETAQELFRSVLYCLGLWMKGFPSPEKALLALEERGVEEGFSQGREKARKMAVSAELFYQAMLSRRVPTDNLLYNGTLLGGIPAFFRQYDAKFFAHRVSVTFDYPLAGRIEELDGIERLRKYLEILDLENRLTMGFSEKTLRRAFALYAIHYQDAARDMTFNLCRCALAQALFCQITEGDVLEAIPGTRRPQGDVSSLLPEAMEAVLEDLRPGERACEYARAMLRESAMNLLLDMRAFAEEE